MSNPQNANKSIERTLVCGVEAGAPNVPVPITVDSFGVPLGLGEIVTELILLDADLDAMNVILGTINGFLSTVAIEQTAIRKQGQVRALAGIAFTITGSVTTLYTAMQAYNSVIVTITNIGGSTYTFTLQHVSGSIVRKLVGPLYSLSPGDTTEITIGGLAAGDLIKGDATNVAIWLSVKGAAE